MKLISSREAVDFLAQVAPRPWVQRMLRLMALDEGLATYSRKGKVQAYGSVSDMTAQLLEKAGQLSGSQMDAAIREEYSEEVAVHLIGKDPFSRFDDEPFTWDESEEPKTLDPGFFLYAFEIDWDYGVLKADYIPHDGEIVNIFFDNSEFLVSELDRPTYEAVIEGLSFEFSKIEMLLPSFNLGHTMGFTTTKSEPRRQVGRPLKWDWEGVMAHVVAQAQQPDGLPTGSGAQARIEEMMAEWFTDETGEAPSPSQIRQRAAKIMRMLSRPKTPKTI